jgi:hypothetical protein
LPEIKEVGRNPVQILGKRNYTNINAQIIIYLVLLQ